MSYAMFSASSFLNFYVTYSTVLATLIFSGFSDDDWIHFQSG